MATRVEVDPDGVRDVAARLRADGARLDELAFGARHMGPLVRGLEARLAGAATWCRHTADDLAEVAAHVDAADGGSLTELGGRAVHVVSRAVSGVRDVGLQAAVEMYRHASVWRGDDWLATWAQDLDVLAYAAQLARDDPAAFAALMLDLEGLAADPGHWLGSSATRLVPTGQAAALGAHVVKVRRRLGRTRASRLAPSGGRRLPELHDLRPRTTRLAATYPTEGVRGALARIRQDGDRLALIRYEARTADDPHLLRDHLGLDDADLRRRFHDLDGVARASGSRRSSHHALSTWDRLTDAEEAIDEAVDAWRDQLDDWLAEATHACVKFSHVSDRVVGRVLLRDRQVSLPTRRYQVVLDRAPETRTGWVVRTSYPLPDSTSRRSPSPC